MKKTLAIILALALLCIMAVGSTLSYFTDTDYDKNTMTVGKVGISQKINGDENGLVSVPMFPVTVNADNTLNNVVELAVTVTMDTDSQDAYVRTVFAFEMEKVDDQWVNPFTNDVTKVDNGIQMTNVEFMKGEVKYVVGYYTYSSVLTAGDTTAPSLKQVYLNSTVGNEFSTAVNGQYEILARSQAVQTQGFGSAQTALDTAFGAITTENAAEIASWFN